MGGKGSAGVAAKGAMKIRKWAAGKDPAVDPPDEVAVYEQWQENGEVVTDPERIAVLEAEAAKQKGSE